MESDRLLERIARGGSETRFEHPRTDRRSPSIPRTRILGKSEDDRRQFQPGLDLHRAEPLILATSPVD